MTNVDILIKDNKLVITVDLTAAGTPSASGKTLTIATTHGFEWFNHLKDSFGVSLNVNKQRK